MTFREVKEAVGYDPECGADANCQHALHVFEGYRDEATQDHPENPYSPGSAQARSWAIGQRLAFKDGLGIRTQQWIT